MNEEKRSCAFIVLFVFAAGLILLLGASFSYGYYVCSGTIAYWSPDGQNVMREFYHRRWPWERQVRFEIEPVLDRVPKMRFAVVWPKGESVTKENLRVIRDEEYDAARWSYWQTIEATEPQEGLAQQRFGEIQK